MKRFIHFFNPKQGLKNETEEYDIIENYTVALQDPNYIAHKNHEVRRQKANLLKAEYILDISNKAIKYDQLKESFFLRLRNLFK